MTGGPAHHVALLSGRLDERRYDTLLVRGHIPAGEPSLDHLAADEGCRTITLDSLAPAIRPLADARALFGLVRVLRSFQPHILHTHTAKAGALGRVASFVAKGPTPIVIHTYHGHVLEHYFNRSVSNVYRAVERVLARHTDRLIGVSASTVEDLVRLRVAHRDTIRTIRVGLDLERFANASADARTDFRKRLGLGPDDVLLAYVGRLAPIKRVDVLLRALSRVVAADDGIRLVVAGDGECRADLVELAQRLTISNHVTFLGNVRDTVPVMAAADVAVLSSDNEGTPVSLIEAAAAGRPAAATAVGGVAEVVSDETGTLVPADSAVALADAILRLAGDPTLRERMGARARSRVMCKFSVSRLLREVDALYEEALAERQAAVRDASRRCRLGRLVNNPDRHRPVT